MPRNDEPWNPAHREPSRSEPPADLDRASAIHDLNQMLAVIAGRADLMLHRGVQGADRDDLEAIALAATDAAAMLARLDGAGPSDLDGQCRLTEEVGRAKRMFRPSADADGSGPAKPQVAIRDEGVPRDLAARVPGQVVREVLANLFQNACEAMPNGGVITVSGRRRGSDTVLRVADDGPGVAPDLLDKLFTAGVSSRAGTDRGIGLAGCRNLLASVGAELIHVADAAAGAVFELTMPAAEESQQPEPAKEIRAGTRVLVVDDEPAVSRMLKDLLHELTCVVTLVDGCATAREAFEAGRYDVLLIDRSLADGSGLELAAELRVCDPFAAVVMMTGVDRADDLDRVDPAAVDLTMIKPMGWDDVRDVVSRGAALSATRRKTEKA